MASKLLCGLKRGLSYYNDTSNASRRTQSISFQSIRNQLVICTPVYFRIDWKVPVPGRAAAASNLRVTEGAFQ